MHLWTNNSVKVLVAQECPTLCDPRDCSLPGFSVPVIFRARILAWGSERLNNSLKVIELVLAELRYEPRALAPVAAFPLLRGVGEEVGTKPQ